MSLRLVEHGRNLNRSPFGLHLLSGCIKNNKKVTRGPYPVSYILSWSDRLPLENSFHFSEF